MSAIDRLAGILFPLPRAASLERARVAKGAAFLDQHADEGWRDQINLRKLDLANGGRCVLGQLYGSYDAAWTRLPRHNDDLRELGFCAPCYDEYRRLTAAWRDEIKSARTDTDLALGGD